MTNVDNSTNSSLDSITIVKSEPFDQDMCETNGSSLYCVTESSDCSSSQLVECKMENTSCTKRVYACEQCGHLNAITSSLQDGFLDSSQSIENSHGPSAFQVSIDPESLELKNTLLPSQSNHILGDSQNHSRSSSDVYSAKKKKRLSFPGDVGADEVLDDDETAQKYVSLLRKTVIDQRKQTKTLAQQNRRQQQRINKLKTMLKELIEKTKNGNYIIEASS